MEALDEKFLIKHISAADEGSSVDKKDNYESHCCSINNDKNKVVDNKHTIGLVRSPAEQKLFKKINKRFVPFLCVLLFFQV